MTVFTQNMRRRRVSLALGTSALACCVVLPEKALAECAPDPTVANATTTCSGADPDGIRIVTSGSTLAIANGATVSNTGAAAITIEVPNIAPSIHETINVTGQVNGGAQSGIMLRTGPVAAYNGSTIRLALTTAAGASVAGGTALDTGQSTGNSYGQLVISVDNAGTLTGSSGIALRGDLATTTNGFTTAWSAFSSVTNRASGVINGGIVGPVGILSNAGLIDGGTGAALGIGNAGTAVPYTINPGAWTNSGTIRSNSSVATASGVGSGLTNSGSILNAGSGAALSSTFLSITNQAGGTIATGGTTAITSSGSITLINRGTVTGNVTGGNARSLIDSSAGRIAGAVTLGSADDTLVVRYDGTQLVTGITGTIDAGGGANLEQVAVTSDTTINTPIALLAGFQQFGVATNAGVTTTLGTGFVPPGTVQVYGGGTLVNQATISMAGSVFVVNGVDSPGIQRLVNQGVLQNTSASGTAILSQSAGFSAIVNAGTIISANVGVSAFQASAANSGTIDSVGTGVTISGNGLTNSGQIRSSGGIGAVLGGNVGTLSTNSGTIQGATIGVETAGFLVNTGTITATNANGTAVVLDPYGAVYNRAGGVIGNGRQAISGNSFNEIVSNAGTINGTVTLSSLYSFGGSQRYISSGAGVLNGNLVLGADGVLFTDLANNGPGAFAGITGTVTAASGAQLRYRVSGAQAATIGPVGPFATPVFEVTSGGALTLTAPGTVTKTLQLAGSGSVDVTADFATATGQSAISTILTLSDQPGYAGTSSALSIVSRGTIAIVHDPAATFSAATAVSLGNDDRFTNLGTITVTDHGTTPSYIAAVGGGAVTNAGAILLDGGFGVRSTSLVNTGSITQISGGVTSVGVESGSVDNSGTIRVGGIAVRASNGNAVINSGTIASTGGIAIGGSESFAAAMIVNGAGGTISGTGGTAVRLYGGALTNAGTIGGSVDLGYGFPLYSGAASRSLSGSAYVAAGGTIAGDLLFGDGADLFLQTTDTLGVSGAIDGGGGRDIYGRQLAVSGTVALELTGVTRFEDRLVQALGAQTVVTTTAAAPFSGTLYAVGNGNVVNQATITGALTTRSPASQSYPFSFDSLFPPTQVLAALTNSGSVGGGVSGAVGSFSNSGSITSSGAFPDQAVSLYGGATLAFANSGTITARTTGYNVPAVYLASNEAMSIANSGRIIGGGLSANVSGTTAAPLSLAFINSGTLTSDLVTAEFQVNSLRAPIGQAIRIDNSGTIAAQGTTTTSNSSGLAVAIDLASYEPSQPITYAITNSNTISARSAGPDSFALAMSVGGAALSGTITNTASGQISAVGPNAFGIVAYGGALTLVNAGTISATGSDLSVAIETSGESAHTVRNTGTIIGDIAFADGADLLDNAGVIDGRVTFGAGDDTLVLRTGSVISGAIDGGLGTDTLRLANPAGTVLSGAVTGFDTIDLGGTALTVTGTLGSTGATLSFTGGDAAVTVGRGGKLAGTIDLGAGNDSFRLSAGGSVESTVSGGAGRNAATLDVTGDQTLPAGRLTNFQRLTIEGGGTLTLAGGDFAYDAVTAAGGLTVASDATLTGAVTFGPADNRLVVAGGFSGSVDGGAGSNGIDVSGGSVAAPVAFSSVSNIQAYRMSAGFATVSGTAAFGGVTLTGGRLVGLPGSVLNAQTFTVGAGATFGSAGTVNGNLAVAGTLSPGASPGTMTVNGNVALAGGSTTVFELTPTVSDKLVVNGAVVIANGATLQFAPIGTLRPGARYDLIVASGGITGSFTTVVKPDGVFGFLTQDAGRLELIGQFADAGGFTPQVSRSITYANATLVTQAATSPLFAALPLLVSADGGPGAQAFARITPEPYASATQIGTDAALTLTDVARGPSFATTGDGVHPYTFAATIGGNHRLGDDPASGAAATANRSYGFLGGVGVGSARWNVGAFGGYLNSRQRIAALGAQTRADGAVAGVHGRFATSGGFGVTATALYDGGAADTTRVLPGAASAAGRYDLHSWAGDVQVRYDYVLRSGWAVRPHAGVTYLRTTRTAVTETSASPFALTVARDRHVAGFADAGMAFGRSEASVAAFRPWVSFGLRYQVEGLQTDTLAGYAGGALALDARGAPRTRAVGTAEGGIAYRLPSGLDLFASAGSQTGTDEHQESLTAGARLRF